MAQQQNIGAQLFFSLMESEKLPPGELKSYCQNQLLQTLSHAANTAPFYAERLKAFRSNPGRIDPETWQQIPLLTRADILNNLDDIASSDYPKGHGGHHFTGTSGTSGISILVKYTTLVALTEAALQDRFYARMRFDGGRRLVHIKGNRTGDYPDGQISTQPWAGEYLGAGGEGLSVQLKQPLAMEKQLEFLNRQGPCYLNTQPSNLSGLAQQMLSEPGTYPNIDIAKVISIGELVQPYHRELARSAFDCEITDIYSATEVGSVAHQCAAGNLHVNSEILHVEVLRDDGTACDENETGRIVVTSTINWAMLLIRYDIGDMGALSTGCSCGSSLPVLKLTVGRNRNLFKFSDGTSVLGLVSLAQFHEFFPAQQWQIAQTGPEELTLRFFSNASEENLDYPRLTLALQEHFQRPLTVLYRRQEALALTASGKRQEAVREI
ncbi:MAG: hypothetical protein ABJM29_08320 [Rhizobiaceae bacterium]